MNRQRTIYGIILAVALVALVVDRLILSESATGPQPADASVAGPVRAPAPSASDLTAATRPAASPANPSLAQRLTNLAEQRKLIVADMADAFRPNLSWVGTTKQAEPVSVKAAPQIALSEVEAFKQRHRLMAVLQNSDGGAAIVGNQTVVPGQTVDGFKLVGLTKRSAIFEKAPFRVELTLPSPQLPAGD